MKVRIEQATAKQLRHYLTEHLEIDVYERATRKVMMAKLNEAEPGVQEIEVSEEFAAANPVAAQQHAPAMAESQTQVTAQTLVKSLMEQGMSEQEALRIAAVTVDHMGGTSRAPTPEEAEKMWCTIRIARGSGKFGNEPIPVGVNGNIQWIPRGENWEVRLPFVATLRNAVSTEYDEVLESDGITTRHVPREVTPYPLEYESAPYFTRKNPNQRRFLNQTEQADAQEA